LLGDEAMAVKVVDVIDSCQHYLALNKEDKLLQFRIYAKFLAENLSENLKKILGDDLEEILK